MALDVANSVILRFDPEKSVDRFAIPEQIESFATAATAFCAERNRFSVLGAPDTADSHALFDLREAIDGYFRALVSEGKGDDRKLADLLFSCGTALRAFPDAQSLANATAHSALSLIAGPDRERLRICGNCGWLFIDRSKNRSRIWCDMAVCGNRQKAAKHYRRKKETVS